MDPLSEYWRGEAHKAIAERDELKRLVGADHALDTLRRELRQSLGREKHLLGQLDQLRQREVRWRQMETDARLSASDAMGKYTSLKRAIRLFAETADVSGLRARLLTMWEQY